MFELSMRMFCSIVKTEILRNAHLAGTQNNADSWPQLFLTRNRKIPLLSIQAIDYLIFKPLQTKYYIVLARRRTPKRGQIGATKLMFWYQAHDIYHFSICCFFLSFFCKAKLWHCFRNLATGEIATIRFCSNY